MKASGVAVESEPHDLLCLEYLRPAHPISNLRSFSRQTFPSTLHLDRSTCRTMHSGNVDFYVGDRVIKHTSKPHFCHSCFCSTRGIKSSRVMAEGGTLAAIRCASSACNCALCCSRRLASGLSDRPALIPPAQQLHTFNLWSRFDHLTNF